MINLFPDDHVSGVVRSEQRRVGIEGYPYVGVDLKLYAGDISEPFCVSSRRNIYNAYYEGLDAAVSNGIRRLKKALKKDSQVCIWFTPYDACEYLAMLAFIEWLTEKGSVIYLCDYSEACPDLHTNMYCKFKAKPEKHLLSNEERRTYLTELAKLKAEDTGLRLMIDGKIVSLPDNHFDARILEVIGDKTVRTIEPYSELFNEMPRMLNFMLYRIRVLIKVGKLEIVKNGKIESGIYGTGDDFGQTLIRRTDLRSR